MEANSIFSKEALDKLRSPDKLDTLLHVTNPIGWMALVAVLLMLLGVVIWSVFGSFTVKVNGMGIIMDSGGVSTINHIAGGRIDRLYVHKGQVIHKGDLIAELQQSAQSADTIMAQNKMTLAQSRTDAYGHAAEYDAKYYQELINKNVYSDIEGIVDEIMVPQGTMLQPGEAICTVRRNSDADEFSGVFYVPLENAKRIETGMTLQLAPNGVDTSQSGSLLATVTSVSQYPVNANGIQKKLGNEQLTQFILQSSKSSVMEIKFDLVSDPENPSGYLWTSMVGNHKPITAGSFVTGFAVVERKPPIEKVFYKLSQWLRSR